MTDQEDQDLKNVKNRAGFAASKNPKDIKVAKYRDGIILKAATEIQAFSQVLSSYSNAVC